MPPIRRLLRWALLAFAGVTLLGLLAAGVLYFMIVPKLPDVDTLRSVELQEPLYVHARDGELIALFGETRRYPVRIGEVPDTIKQAFIAIEDNRFYEHPGVDYKGVARAIWLLATTDDERVPGGSTITQQVARQFYLTSEYSYTRKLAEMLLALKMERELSKDEIFELYLNKSFFGNRAYGIAAAAEFYYGKTLSELTLDEVATLAGTPKFPSSGNPVSNPERNRIRRDYIVQRMAELGFITEAEMREAQAAPMHAEPHERPIEAYAPYVAEMVRQEMIERFGEDVLVRGRLQLRGDGGGDVVAADKHVLAEALDHLLADHFGHVRRVGLDRALVRLGVHRGRLRLAHFRLGDEAQFGHPLHDVVPADPVAFRIADRVAAGRELRGARQGGDLVQGQFGQRLAVVELRGRGDAVGPVPEEALVEVQLEDLVLAQLALHFQRQQHLGELARVAVLGGQVELAGNLLGDGRAARDALVVGGGQQPDGAGHALVVDAGVLVEPVVLDRDEGLRDVLGDFLDLDRITPRLTEQCDQLAVARMDVKRLLQFHRAQGVHVRELGNDREIQQRRAQKAKQGDAGEREQRPAQQAADGGHRGEFPGFLDCPAV